jgi:hypothetical protein
MSMREIVQTDIVPEIRALRESVEALRADIRATTKDLRQ